MPKKITARLSSLSLGGLVISSFLSSVALAEAFKEVPEFNDLSSLLIPELKLNTGFESAGKFTVQLPDTTGGTTFSSLLLSYGDAMISGKCNNNLYYTYNFNVASGTPQNYTQTFQSFFLRGSNIYAAAQSVSVVPSNVACISFQSVNNEHALSNVCDQAVTCTSDATASVCAANALNNCPMTFNTPLAYVTNYAEQLVMQCSVDSTGLLAGCAPIATPGLSYSSTEGPGDIIITQDGSTAYISLISGTIPFAGPPTGGDIIKCTINTDGSFNACTAQNISTKGATNVVPVGLALKSSANALYVSSEYGDENVFRCVLDASGNISSCADAGAPAGAVFNTPIGLTLNASQNRIYVTNTNQGSTPQPVVEVCDIDASTGLFTACQGTGNTGSSVSSSAIALNQLNGLAYFTDLGTGQIVQCSIDNSTGLFTGCSSSIAGGGLFNFPIRMVFNASNTISYVVQLNLPSSSPIVTNFAGKCDVNSTNGNLSCISAEPSTDTYTYTTATGLALRFA